MTLKQIVKGKCSTCLWHQGRCLARTVRSGNYYCKYYVSSEAYSPKPNFIVKIKQINGSYFVYLNDKKLPNPALKQSAPMHFLAYKLIELTRLYSGDNLGLTTIRIIDPTAIKMLNAILDSCKQQNKKIIAGSMVLAFARYASRVKIGSLYVDNSSLKKDNGEPGFFHVLYSTSCK